MLSRRTAAVVPNTDLLKDKECASKRNRCSKRHVRKSTETTKQYVHDGKPAKSTGLLIGWKEKDTMLYDRIALEKQIHVATRAENIQNSKHWILTLNAEGPQQPLNQRPDIAQANRECKDYRTIPRSQQVRQRKEQLFEGTEEFDYAVDPKTDWRFCKESR